MKEEEKI